VDWVGTGKVLYMCVCLAQKEKTNEVDMESIHESHQSVAFSKKE
jgi:hypothetical protein